MKIEFNSIKKVKNTKTSEVKFFTSSLGLNTFLRDNLDWVVVF